MRLLALLLALFTGALLTGQDIKKPEYVIIANGKIITKDRLEEYARAGQMKGMNKGVSEEKRAELIAIHGDVIPEKEFIITIDLLTEEEIAQRQQSGPLKPVPMTSGIPDSLKLRAGDTPGDFSVEMTDGTTVRLSELRGKVVLVNFWATWCGPCLMEFHEIPGKVLTPFKDEDFVFLPISRGEDMEKVSAKLAALKPKGIDFPSGVDPESATWRKHLTKSIPMNFVIDREGTIRYVSLGNSEGSVDKLAAEIRALLKGTRSE